MDPGIKFRDDFNTRIKSVYDGLLKDSAFGKKGFVFCLFNYRHSPERMAGSFGSG